MEYYYGILVMGENLETVKEFIGVFCASSTKLKAKLSSEECIEAHYFKGNARITFWGLQTKNLGWFLDYKTCDLLSYSLKIVYLNDGVMGSITDFNGFLKIATRSHANSIKIPSLLRSPIFIVHIVWIDSKKSSENSLNLQDLSIVEQMSISGTFQEHSEEIKEVN